MTMLHEKFSNYKSMAGENVFSDLVPDYIKNNINPDFELRPYQSEAFGRFEYYLDSYPNKPKYSPVNVLFHMATGSGKTLIMAGEILTLYKRGYRNFLFFVPSLNIIKKTKENFLNKASSKYLFNDIIIIDGQQVRIREVSSFASNNSDDINIVFSTNNGLHAIMQNPKENTLSMEDFEDHKVVLISDETHHINADTKNHKTSEERLNAVSWEQTVKRIFNANLENVMLEFTATADLTEPAIQQKYQDVVLFDYPLKQFRLDLYSKEVKVLQADSEPLDRAIQAIVLSQYRRKIFEKHKILIKPVVLFKSKTIPESKAFHKAFIEAISKISKDDLKKVENLAVGSNVIRKAFEFFKTNNIRLEDVALELKEDFSREKTIEVNSKESLESQQILLNTLEDSDNEIRAVFAVDKLNEGWDVLNLFDIVRLYDTRDARSNKVGKTTLQEAQLIGRGARYCPFQINNEQPLYQRKYDILDDTTEAHELKICEELYYHAAHNPKYIQELNQALQELGIKAKTTLELPLKLKKSFRLTQLYRTGLIYVNKREAYDRSEVIGLDDSIINTSYSYAIKTGHSSELTVFEESKTKSINTDSRVFNLSVFGTHLVRKAVASTPEYRFNQLTKMFPNLSSINEFIESPNYLGKINITISGNQDVLDNLPQIEKLNAAKKILREIAENLNVNRIDYKGSHEFLPKRIDQIYENDKILNIANDRLTNKEFGIGQNETNNLDLILDLSTRDWFAFSENYGTSEEKYLVRFIDSMITELQKKYDEVYLLRNEKHFKLYSFEDGRAFEPDFILFLSKNDDGVELNYQVFIEPKGGNIIPKDIWKQNFLLDLQSKHKIDQVWRNKEFIVWGLPFYNYETHVKDFSPAFQELL